LFRYLENNSNWHPEDFHENPWNTQVLPHIEMQPDKRQVKIADGYFTEVAVRLKDGWCFIVGFSGDILQTESIVRLGGEGHRALVSQILKLEPKQLQGETQEHYEKRQEFYATLLNKLANTDSPGKSSNFAYLLTPGLALAETRYSAYPQDWKSQLKGCATDKALLWGGVSTLRKDNKTKEEFALLPQRAFVPPGTVYIFDAELPAKLELLPKQDGRWWSTFKQLNYGKLLWGSR
jgi:CRISPR-associated protein Cmr3